LANTKSAEKAARQSTAHRARNDGLTSKLRSAIRKATLALKAGKHDEAASALAAATPVIDSMVNKGIIHRNKAAPRQCRRTGLWPVFLCLRVGGGACAGGPRMFLEITHNGLF
jgi:small subunit ribosomal protein S20